MFIPGPNLQVRAHHCYVGQEGNGKIKWRWELSYEDPCLCTSLRFIDTPKRDFDPALHVEAPLLSDDLKEIRDYFGIECKGMD